MKNKKQEKDFFSWVVRKWHFWLLSVGWALWSAFESLLEGDFISVLGTVGGWIIVMGIIYFVIFRIKKSIKKEETKEEKNKKFFDWLLKNPVFWISSIIVGTWNGLEDLINHEFAGYFGTLLAHMVIVGFVFFIIFKIIKYLKNKKR